MPTRRGPPDLSATVRRFSFPVTLRTYGASTIDADGLTVPGATTDETILAHVQDAPPDVLARLPAGTSNGRVIIGYTLADIHRGDEAAQTRPSVVVWQGVTFEVFEVTEVPAGRDGLATWRHFLASEVVR